jgi:hypothetical protein
MQVCAGGEQHATARGALAALADARNDQVALELGEPAQHRQSRTP